MVLQGLIPIILQRSLRKSLAWGDVGSLTCRFVTLGAIIWETDFKLWEVSCQRY